MTTAQDAIADTSAYADIAAEFDRYALEADRWTERTKGYHGLVRSIYRAMVPSDARVLEIGCGRGDLLAALQPSRGVGVDVSPGMVEAARRRHPELEFICAPGESISLGQSFDYIVLSDLVPYVHDLQALMATVAAHCDDGTRVIANTYSNLWRAPLWVTQKLGLRPERPVRNWVTPTDLDHLCDLGGLEVIARRNEILLPAGSGRLTNLVNGALARLPVMRWFALSYWLIARRPVREDRADVGVSVVIPCRNESGSIDDIVRRVPQMGSGTELIFVEGGSTDDTRQRIQAAIDANPDRDMSLMVQTGTGKANAVHEAFATARHDVLMILDADLTVAPEDLPKFYTALRSGRGELINGSRLVYEMEPGAMRYMNMVGNRVFAALLRRVLGQYVKDTLCGTKALARDDYRRIMAKRHEIESDDPFGDFDLLLGASLLGLKIVDVPVRYGSRTYGETNIDRFTAGPQLLRLARAGFRRLWMRPVER